MQTTSDADDLVKLLGEKRNSLKYNFFFYPKVFKLFLNFHSMWRLWSKMQRKTPKKFSILSLIRELDCYSPMFQITTLLHGCSPHMELAQRQRSNHWAWCPCSTRRVQSPGELPCRSPPKIFSNGGGPALDIQSLSHATNHHLSFNTKWIGNQPVPFTDPIFSSSNDFEHKFPITITMVL